MRVKTGRVFESQRKAIVVLIFGILIGFTISEAYSPEPVVVVQPQLGTNVTIVSSPPDGANKVIALIKDAKTSIHLSIYFLDHSGINSALKDAAARGVPVRIITDEESPTKKISGCEIRVCHFYRLYHVKVLIIDSEIVFLGSHNYSGPAFSSNRELSIVTNSTSLAGQLVQYFETDWIRSIPT